MSRLAKILPVCLAALLLLPAACSRSPGAEQALSAVRVIQEACPLPCPADASVSAESAALIEAESGRILWSKCPDKALPMASTTKIMTSLICLRRQDLDVPFTVNGEAIQEEGSSMGLREGDTVTLRALAVGMLTVSGNDAANAAAVRISGSVRAFAGLMNAAAAELGMKDTFFVTPSGLDSGRHHSTAGDMAALAAEAIRNPDFLQICSSASSLAVYGNPPYARLIMNENRLLRIYEGAIGVKEGYTLKAGRCLVSAARREGKTVVCVTLNSPDAWNDHALLLDYGFSVLERVEITESLNFEIPVAGTDRKVAVTSGGSAQMTCLQGESGLIERKIELPEFTEAPVRTGQAVGKIRYCYNGKPVAEADLTAVSDVG